MGSEPENSSGPAAEALSPADATLLCATTPQMQLQIGGLCRFEAGPLRDDEGRLRHDDLRAHVASRLHLVPRFRQRIQRVPFDLSRPVWVDDDGFDLERHLQTVVLPAPGGPRELREFVAGLLSKPLNFDHPLWDMWLVDGLGGTGGDEVALVLRVHHVMADGLSLLREAMALLDFEPEPRSEPAPGPWRPVPAPGPLGLAASGQFERRRQQLSIAVDTTRRLLNPRWALDGIRSAVSVASAPPRIAPGMPVTGPVGTRRDFLFASVPFDPLLDLSRSRGVTFNDVLLAAVTGALRRLLGPEESAALVDHTPRVLVPVGDTSGAESGNLFSFVVADLPVHLEDPVDVLDHVHVDMDERKSSQQSSDMLSLFSVIDVLPVPLLRRVIPEVLARQPFVNLAVTNIPGSPVPLYLLGSRMLELQPIVCGVGNIACIVGVLSYCGRLGIGVTVDPDVVPDPDALRDALLHAVDDLTREVGGT